MVRDPETHRNVLENITTFTEQMGWCTVNLDYSPITGPKGNIEFLAEIRKQDGNRKGIAADRIQAVVNEAHENMIHS